MSKLTPTNRNGKLVGYRFRCPACGFSHCFYTHPDDELKAELGPRPDNPTKFGWDFNGDFEKPTFTPSLLGEVDEGVICHLNLTNGVLIYHNDCTHALRNQQVPLEAKPKE